MAVLSRNGDGLVNAVIKRQLGCLTIQFRHADLCEDTNWKDHYAGSGELRYHRQCQGEDSSEKGVI